MLSQKFLNTDRMTLPLLVLSFYILFIPHSILAEALQKYDGQIVPKDFIAFSAPQNTMSLPFWGSSSNGIQLLTVEKEEKKVKAGDCIAEFQFRMEGARDHLDRQFPQIRANNEKALLAMQKEIVTIRQNLEEISIRTQQAKLDLQKKSHLSLIKQKILDCDFNILSFETQALKHKLDAAIKNLEIQRLLFQKRENIWQSYYSIFESTRLRFKIYSPEDGYLFYPVLEAQNRKVRAGDRFNSGVHFLSLAKSEKKELIFYLPEKDFMKVSNGDQVFIELLAKTEVPAKVREIGFFPQLLGDLTKSYELPNAWDKCFIVKADIIGDLKSSDLGSVKVRLAK